MQSASGLDDGDADEFDDSITLIEAARRTRKQNLPHYLASQRNDEGSRWSLDMDHRRFLDSTE